MCSLFSTHTFYKVFQLSHVPTSYFGGNSVTHYFGHPCDQLTICVLLTPLFPEATEEIRLSP
jgi:hypothetical protein